MRALSPAQLPARPARLLSTHRVRLDDGAATTLYVAWYPRADTDVRVVLLPEPVPLARWCRESGNPDALVGGFYVRPHGKPLGELRIGGAELPSVPFTDPWARTRACVHVSAGDGVVALARRDELPPQPDGDLLQAGPMLLRAGEYAAAGDPEGFSAGAAQFDSDITDGRYPRAALGAADDWLLAAVCDGRAEDEAGMTMAELATALRRLGARDAINLDGGGSSSLVCDGRLLNVPREGHGIPLVAGRAVTTALSFTTR